MRVTALDVLLEDFGHRPPKGTARGYWLRLASASKATLND